MKTLCWFFILLPVSLSNNDVIDALLLYEDQRDGQPSTSFDEPNVNFLTLKRKFHQENKEFADLTFCYRLYVLSHKFLSSPFQLRTDKYVQIINPQTGQTIFQTDRLNVLFGVYYGIGLNTFSDSLYEVLDENGIYVLLPDSGIESLNANQWHSICIGFDVQHRTIYMVQNGQTLINISQPEIWAEKNRGYDTSMIGPVKLNKKEEGFKKGKEATQWSGFMIGQANHPFSGYLTDIQIFGESLSTKEMHDITSCQLSKKGDMYAWDADDWEPYDKERQENKNPEVQYRKVKIPQQSLCKAAEKYTFFPDGLGFQESMNLCRRFGGKLIDVSTTAQRNAVVTFLGKKIKENPKYDVTIGVTSYTSYTDEKELNVWRHYETGELPVDPLIWNVGEPNGGMVENCATLLVQSNMDGSKYIATFNDVGCDNPHAVACQDIGTLLLKLRGICKFSLIDNTYSMIEGDKNKKRFLAGNTGWRIFWDTNGELWRLSSPKEENMYGIHTEFATYPLGKNYWSILNDTKCTYPNNEKVLLNLSPCNSTSFTCDDGTCILMTGR